MICVHQHFMVLARKVLENFENEFITKVLAIPSLQHPDPVSTPEQRTGVHDDDRMVDFEELDHEGLRIFSTKYKAYRRSPRVCSMAEDASLLSSYGFEFIDKLLRAEGNERIDLITVNIQGITHDFLPDAMKKATIYGHSSSKADLEVDNPCNYGWARFKDPDFDGYMAMWPLKRPCDFALREWGWVFWDEGRFHSEHDEAVRRIHHTGLNISGSLYSTGLSVQEQLIDCEIPRREMRRLQKEYAPRTLPWLEI